MDFVVRIFLLVLLVFDRVHPFHMLYQVATLARSHITEETLVGSLTQVFDGNVAAQRRATRVSLLAYLAS